MDQPYITDKPVPVPAKPPALPGQVVLVFQGGGALGAYQGGVYEALQPGWDRAELGHRHVDRRHQCRHYRR